MVQTSRTVRIPAFFLFGKDGYVYVQLCWATFTVGSYNSDSYVLIGFTDPNPCLIDYFVLCNCESYGFFFMDILLTGMRIFRGSAKCRGFCLARTDLVNRPDP